MKLKTQTAAQFLRAGVRIVRARAKTHGTPNRNHTNIAALWNAYLTASGRDGDLAGSDVAMMMLLLKVARQFTGEFNPDDLLDIIGYAGVHAEVRTAERR